MEQFNLCIIKPNKDAFSETFIQAHVDRLAGNKKVLYGGAFPVYDQEGKTLIRSKLGLLSYLIQKRIFKKENIGVRTRALYKYLKEYNIDVVLAEYGMVGASVAEACKMAAVPLVIHFHGADAHHRPTIGKYLPLYPQAFDYASAIVAVSNDMVEALKKMGAPASKIHLNPYGVDGTRFPLIDISNSGPDFLSVGRFVEKKSPLSVIRAFKQVHLSFPEAHLWMVGDGPLLDNTRQLVSELGLSDSVTLTGVMTSAEIRALMEKVRCFVQHSVTAADGDMEGTPNTILEAASAGLAIVSTAHAGIKEAVVDDVTGFLVPEHDIDAMAAKMKQIAGDIKLAAKMGLAAHDHIVENYDINKRIALLDNIIQSSITNKN
ncbi:glycosyltransferase [Mucilaginibacter sp. Mucisp86]|uniref:glycosyltransferase n=1 Tax=Mucilaginibacter sp. Mucisp86 TaxID=3243060 RepID=UPI0039B69E43